MKHGQAWCNGGDPEDGGWFFTEAGVAVDGYAMAYQTNSREDALDEGVPEALLDAFEQDGGDYTAPGGGLFCWLQGNSGLFETTDGPPA